MITVFTPTYNRRQLIERLYNSLKCQTSKIFEWLIVDDGSTDDTYEYLNSLQETSFPVRYLKQENAGKHIAINTGASNAKGEWFIVVDSDDYLVPTAIEEYTLMSQLIENKPEYAAVCSNRMYMDGSPNGSTINYDTLEATFSEYGNKYKYRGDKPSLMRTSVWKEFPFPEYKGEKFCTEGLILNRISEKYKNLYVNKTLYVMEGYLNDGLTQSIKEHYENSPTYSALYYKELFENPYISFIYKMACVRSYWHHYYHSKHKNDIKPTIKLTLLYPAYILGSLIKKFKK